MSNHNGKMVTLPQNDLLWYQNGLEKLEPLRYHLFELIMEMEFHNSYAKRVKQPQLNKKKIAQAKKALERAEKFFTRQ